MTSQYKTNLFTTSKLQYNYQFYIQERLSEDTQGFQSTAPSRSFSNKYQEQKVWTSFFLIFSLIFIFFLIYFCTFLFIELMVRISHVTQEKKHRKHQKNDVIQHTQHMLALRYTHSCLGQARSTQHGPYAFSIKGRQSCKEFSIEFSCVISIQGFFF